jgi:hypothetical protein
VVFAGAAGVAATFAAPVVTFDAATAGFDFDSADTVVSPVDTLSTGEDGVAAAVVDAVAESAVVLSALPASRRPHAAAKLRTLPTSTTRPISEAEEGTNSSKQRFIDMLVRSCTVLKRWSLSAWCPL